MKSVKGAKKALKKILGSTPKTAKNHTPKEYMIVDRNGVVDEGLSARSFADAMDRHAKNRKMEIERLQLKASGKKPPRKQVTKKTKAPKVEGKKKKSGKKKGSGESEE